MKNETVDRFEDQALYEGWDDDYYRDGYNEFYDELMAELVRELALSEGDSVLDAGCGPGVHSIRLARLGLRCTSIDFSSAALDIARQRVEAAGFADRVEFRQEDLTQLTFGDESVPSIVCWGVMMHIPEPEKAIAELSRVLVPGGRMAVSMTNARSFDTFLMRDVAYRFKTPRTLVDSGSSSMGRYTVFREHDSDLFVQALYPDRVIAAFERQGLRLQRHFGAQFTELYTQFGSSAIRKISLALNRFWYRSVRRPGPSIQNLLLLEKPK